MKPSEDMERLSHLLQGYRATCLLMTSVQLGLIEQLGVGPMSEAVLAGRIGAHLPSLRRFLRGLEVIGIIQREPVGVGLSAMGKLLLKEASVMADRVALTGEEYLPAWTNLCHAVRTGEPAFNQIFEMSAWEHRREHPELNECFTRIMSEDQIQTHRAVVSAYDFSRCNLAVDVGGGDGSLLGEILAEYSNCSGVVFDQPHVVERAPGLANSAGLRNRCQFVAGSFFDSIPSGGDIYLLRHILHDWDDSHCLAILRNCHSVMETGSKLLIIENLLPETLPPPEKLVMMDLHMMAVLGGRERTGREYEELLASAGLSPTLRVPTDAQTTIIAAVRSSAPK